jgi:hypothetical protein
MSRRQEIKREGRVVLSAVLNSQSDNRKNFLGYELAVLQAKKVMGGAHIEQRYPLESETPRQLWHYGMCELHWAELAFKILVTHQGALKARVETSQTAIIAYARPWLPSGTNLKPSRGNAEGSQDSIVDVRSAAKCEEYAV